MRAGIVVVFCLLAAGVWARLGENAVQCRQRYGAPVREVSEGKFTIQEFVKSGVRVRVFLALQSHELLSSTSAVGIVYWKPTESGAQNQLLTPDEIRAFLDANGQLGSWSEISALKAAAAVQPGPEQDRLIRDAIEYTIWARSDGAKAYYLKKTHYLLIRTDESVPMPKPEVPKDLDGF
jgi:hypothetical protein